MTHKIIRIHQEPKSSIIRHETFEGRDHLVVPVVMICEGVLNGALVPAEELIACAEAWNGRPVPILHPKQAGEYTTANDPRTIEQNVVGQVFSAKAEEGKLKAELWIDVAKATKLGHAETIEALESESMIEVSTGYYCDEQPETGEFKGVKYNIIHRNLKPDHLALLPGETGACSIEDGCGAPRINSKQEEPEKMATEKKKVKLGEAVDCPLCDKVKALHTNGSITTKELETIEDLVNKIGVENLSRLAEVFAQLVEPLKEKEEEIEAPEAVAEEGEKEKEEEEEPIIEKTSTMTAAQMAAMVKKMVADALPSLMTATTKRTDITNRLRANERNPLTEEEMASTPVTTLEKMEQSLRSVDYSGRGGFAVNANEAIEPLMPPRGVFSK